MNKTKLKYVKYTKKELDQYVRDKNSCIALTTSKMHVGFPPWGFANFQETLTNIISRDKVGKYDSKLDGIVLDVRNIKVFGTSYAVHDDDPINHINIKANFYLFQPRIGAIIKGVVKHISHGHVAVIIYRVFNVSIRFNRENIRDSLEINQQISFRIKKFDMSGAMPYIEGEFIGVIRQKPKVEPSVNKHSRFDDAEAGTSGADSGISAEETNSKRIVKKEESSECESSDEESSSQSDSDDVTSKRNLVDQLFKDVKIKKEKPSETDDDDDGDEDDDDDDADDTPAKSPPSKSKESSDESSSEESSSEESEKGEAKPKPGVLKNIKKENVSSSESSSESESSGSESDSDTSDEQKKPTNNFTPIQIKKPPSSDEDEPTPFKKPATSNGHSSNNTHKLETAGRKRKRTSSITEQLQALLEQHAKPPTDKRKSLPNKLNESMDVGNFSNFSSPALSSTLKPKSKLNRVKDILEAPTKIKKETESADEVAKKKKKKLNGKL